MNVRALHLPRPSLSTIRARAWWAFSTARERIRSYPLVDKGCRYLKLWALVPLQLKRMCESGILRQQQLDNAGVRTAMELARSQSDRIRTIGVEQHEIRRRIEEQSRQIVDLFEAMAEELFNRFNENNQIAEKRMADACKAFERRQQGTNSFLDLMSRKMTMLAVDMRERVPPYPDLLPEPRIVNPGAYAAKSASMTSGLLVNLGCGEKPAAGYINVDFRELPDVDVVADVRRLPFAPASLAELSSSHLVEHFRERQLVSTVLPYWKSLLRENGKLRIICPNFDAMIRWHESGRMSYDDFRTVTFGLQDYEGDDHFAMYTPTTLTAILKEAGFTWVETIEVERQNGKCPEMELLASLAA